MKGGEHANMTRACLYVERLCITNACFHTEAGMEVECLDYVDEFVRIPVMFKYFPMLCSFILHRFIRCRIATSESQPLLLSACCQHALLADLAEQVSLDGDQCGASTVVAIAAIPVIRLFHDDTTS